MKLPKKNSQRPCSRAPEPYGSTQCVREESPIASFSWDILGCLRLVRWRHSVFGSDAAPVCVDPQLLMVVAAQNFNNLKDSTGIGQLLQVPQQVAF